MISSTLTLLRYFVTHSVFKNTLNEANQQTIDSRSWDYIINRLTDYINHTCISHNISYISCKTVYLSVPIVIYYSIIGSYYLYFILSDQNYI